MKQFLLLIFTLVCTCTNAKVYKPLFTNGKMWKGISIYKEEPLYNANFTVTVSGDTIINGKTCKKLHFDVATVSGSKNQYDMVVYEDNGKVYTYNWFYYDNGFVPVLDFSLQKGDKIADGSQAAIEDDYTEVDGQKVHRTKFGKKDASGVYPVWVEGVGPNTNFYYTPPTSTPLRGVDPKYLLECYDNGKLIYSADDFMKEWDTNTYKPLLTDGKSWKWETHHEMWNKDTYATITVCGDSIVGGKKCKKLLFGDISDEDSYYKVAYEDDGAVYTYYDNKFVKVLDFNMQIGDVTDGGHYKVVDKDVVDLEGETVRRIKLQLNDWSDKYIVWTEGVGPNTNYYYTALAIVDGTSQRMIECRDNGKLIYSADDFMQGWGTNGIAAPAVGKASHGTTYDLSGRATTTTKRGEVYISDGKKRVAR